MCLPPTCLSACPFGYLWIISFSATQRHNTFLAAAYLLRCCRDAVIDDAACRPAAEVLCRCHSQCIHHAVIVAVTQANPWATELEELRVKYRLEVLQRKLLYNQVRINQFSTFRGSHGHCSAMMGGAHSKRRLSNAGARIKGEYPCVLPCAGGEDNFISPTPSLGTCHLRWPRIFRIEVGRPSVGLP